MLRHAIDAAEVTPVGYRHTQISDGALKRIDQSARLLMGAFNCGAAVGQRHAEIPMCSDRSVCSVSYRNSGPYWPWRPVAPARARCDAPGGLSTNSDEQAADLWARAKTTARVPPSSAPAQVQPPPASVARPASSSLRAF